MVGWLGRVAWCALFVTACSLGFDGENLQGQPAAAGSTSPCAAEQLFSPVVPMGWQGPVLKATAPDEDSLPSCPFVWSMVHSELESDPYECECVCGTDPESACTAELTLYAEGSNCNGVNFPFALAGICQKVSVLGFTSGDAKWKPMGDPCVAVPTVPRVPNVEWSNHTLLCAASATPLANGALCASPLAGFDTAVCIYAEGEGDCPSDFPIRHQHYQDYSDSRGCASCTCAGGTCAGLVQVTPGDVGCQPSSEGIEADHCTTVSAPSGTAWVQYAAVAVGTCAPSGGGEEGELLPTAPLVVCCTS